MQLPQTQFRERARNVFKRLYQNRRFNVSASKYSLEEQLELFLDHIGTHIGHNVIKRDRNRIWSVIERNNQVSQTINSPSYQKIVDRNKQLIGNTFLGFVFCIDGRIPAIFLGGRFAKHYEVPAAEITVIKRKSDGKLIPDSTDLNEALRSAATCDDELLEIVLAHTSFLDPHHGCGAMAAKRKAKLIDEKLTLEDANLKIIKDKTIPAITNIYNEFREQLGKEPLDTVGISGVYDTDSFGIILNHDLRGSNEQFSTTEFAKTFKEELDDYFIKNNLVLGTFREKFSNLKYLQILSQNLLNVTEAILESKVAPKLSITIHEYVANYYPQLTENQKQALRFVLSRTIAFQYLTGLCNVKKSTLDHPFAEHEEAFMSIAMRGATIGKFDPENQAFSSTPADPDSAINYIKVMMSIMGDSPKIKPYILFVCNSVNSRDLEEDNQIVQRISGSNAGLLRDIIFDKILGPMIEKGEIIPVPVLIDEETREVLKILDHSAYI